MTQPEINHATAEQLVRDRVGRTDKKLRCFRTRKLSAWTLAGSLKRVLLQPVWCCQARKRSDAGRASYG